MQHFEWTYSDKKFKQRYRLDHVVGWNSSSLRDNERCRSICSSQKVSMRLQLSSIAEVAM